MTPEQQTLLVGGLLGFVLGVLPTLGILWGAWARFRTAWFEQQTAMLNAQTRELARMVHEEHAQTREIARNGPANVLAGEVLEAQHLHNAEKAKRI